MANVGDQRGPLFERHYVASNPNNATGPLTWNLSDRDISSGIIGGGSADKIPIVSGSGVLAEDCLQGELLYIITSGPTAGELALAKADSIETSIVVGAALANASAGSNISYTRNSSLLLSQSANMLDTPPNLDPGKTYYLSPINAGNYTKTVPTTTGHVIVDVGTALDAANIAIEIQPPIQL